MTTPNPIDQAVSLLRAAAHELQLSHTKADDRENWTGEPDAKAAYDEHMAAAAALEGPADPLDWPLPCDVTVGHGTIHKGVTLRTLVLRMKGLYKMATGHDADEIAGRTLEQRAELLAALQAAVEPAAVVLPKPAAWINQRCVVQDGECAGHEPQELNFNRHGDWGKSIALYTEQQVRALLAATPPAQPQAAVPVGFALVPLRITRAMDEVLRDEGWQWEDLLAAANAVTEEQYEAIAHDRLSRDEVRALLLEHGYTIKEGQTDLKPYVYEAAAELEDLVRSRLASAPQAQDVQRDAAHVSLPIHWMKELVALCGPEDHELRDRVLKSLERLPLAHAGKLDELNKGEVLVVVTGYTGTGKSAVAGEIEIMCRALGLEVEWPGGDSEKNMTHADWTAALEQYRPRVRIVERNVPGPIAASAAQGEA